MLTLKNGATVINKLGDYVMASFNGEYVTWAVDPSGGAYWGHYFGLDMKGATADLIKRNDESNG